MPTTTKRSTNRATEKQRENNVPAEKKLDELYEIIKDVEIAMLTTVEPDGSLTSRPMATQKPHDGADLWFMTTLDTHKVDVLSKNPHVNVAYYNEKSREWVSVSGIAKLNRDRDTIHDLYAKDWKAWLADEGGDRDGGPDDPRIVLIEVDAREATYMKSNTPRVVALFRVAKGIATGEPPKIGDLRHVQEGEFDAHPDR
jgi:general stress protein 26